MYNFSGIFYRIWSSCGFMFLLGVGMLLAHKPWSENFKLKKCKIELALIAVSVCLGLFYASRIAFPNVSSYTGEFVEEHRSPRTAPPLPFTMKYTFWNGEGKRIPLYLDVLSKKEIFPYEFEKGKEYTVYYDTLTDVITRIEVVE